MQARQCAAVKPINTEQHRIVEENLKLVAHAIRKMWPTVQRSGLGREDAYQIGCEGLCKAVSRWNPERAVLSTYAEYYIRGAILRACAENSLIHISQETLRRQPETRKTVLSLQAPLFTDGESLQTLEDILPGGVEADKRVEISDVWGIFTPREQQVLEAKMLGYTQRDIARMIGRSNAAVAWIMSNIRAKTAIYYGRNIG